MTDLVMQREAGNTARIIYLPHGGGPMPLLGDPGHAALTAFLQTLPDSLGSPEAIVVISAHWEEDVPTLTGGESPDLIYDYGGFPPESYRITWPAPGNPPLADEIAALLEAAGMSAAVNPQRGYDHGVFVPLKLMFPDANIPCIQLSLLNSLDARAHIALGKALAPLRDRNILVVGSGMSFHNIRAFFVEGLVSREDNLAFDAWLVTACSDPGLTAEEREAHLANWHLAPSAIKCHPRPEHLLPLHVCYGMASEVSPVAEVIFSDEVMGKRVTGLLW